MFVKISHLKRHEKTDPIRRNEVRKDLLEKGRMHAVVADRKTRILLDGHHRVHAAESLGFRKVPVVWVDYEKINVSSRRPSIRIDKEAIKSKVGKGKLFPHKTTRHRIGRKHVSHLTRDKTVVLETLR